MNPCREASSALALSLLLFLVLFPAPPAAAQVVIRHGGSEPGGDVVVLQEIGIVAGLQEGSEDLQVLVLIPGKERDVDLAMGDLLLMINGKRVRDAAALREAYEAAAPGEVVKLGFRRGDERFLATFERQAAEAGGTRVMMLAGPGSDLGDLQPLEEFGVILGERDGAVIVALQLPGDAALRKDDVLRSLNGREIRSLADFRSAYDGLAVGDEVALVVRRGDGDVDVTRAKAEPSAMIRVRRHE